MRAVAGVAGRDWVAAEEGRVPAEGERAVAVVAWAAVETAPGAAFAGLVVDWAAARSCTGARTNTFVRS